jgi:2-polyprenyl-3-methyl-5-hydroxy-6-metoxy-1,4-benzoquinol methylase
VTEESHYLALAAAYARGALGRPDLDDAAALAAGRDAELRLHRFKRTSGLPRVRRVIGALRGFGVARLLDVGSGRGAFLWPMVDALPEVEVTAIDVLPHRVAAIEAVRRGGIARVTAARMDATRLGLADASVDVVTLLEVIEHMPDPAPAVAEALRVARTAIVITVPSHEDNNPEHLHLFDGARLEALCKAGGARRVVIEHVPGHIVCTAVR